MLQELEMTPIVIPLHHKGGKFGDNTELRFAIRSIDKHFKGEYELAIVGRVIPEWLTGVRHVQQVKGGLKTALLLASETFPDGFVWFYDDCCLLRPSTVDELKVIPACRKWRKINSAWGRSLEKIRERLDREGFPAFDYSCPHGPYWFDKGIVDEAFRDWPGMAGKFPWESWILSKRDWPRCHGNVKQYYGKFSKPPDPHIRILNYSDKGTTPELLGYLKSIFPEPSKFEKSGAIRTEGKTRGIVTLAGGPVYSTNAYINCRMLRKLGCDLPIEWFYLGDEMSLVWLEIIRDTIPGVTLVNLGGPAKNNRKSKGGWQAKVEAVLQSRFDEILFLDADSFPLRDPSYLFDHPFFRERDCVLWPDIHNYGRGMRDTILRKYGVSVSGRQVESGQMMFHKSASLPGLLKTSQLNRDSADTYQCLYGDKDTFLIGAKQAGVNCTINPHVVRRCRPRNLIQHDFEGRPMFCHLTGGKWSPSTIARVTMEDYPHLREATGILKELDNLTRRRTIMHVRDTFSASETDRIINGDMYHIRPMVGHRVPVKFIVDIGGNAGSFTVAASRAYPDAEIIVIEPDPELMEDIRHNTRDCVAKIHYVEAACVARDDDTVTFVRTNISRCGSFVSGTPWASSQQTSSEDETLTVKAVRLPELLDQFGFTSIDILKIDAEGVEGEILTHLKETGWMPKLHWIRGEWHGRDSWSVIEAALAGTHVHRLQDSAFNGEMIAHNVQDA